MARPEPASDQGAIRWILAVLDSSGRKPQKPLKGQFNVRIPPALHKEAALRALKKSISLNEVVVYALDAYLNARDVNHVETKNYFVGTSKLQQVLASAGSQSEQQYILVASTGEKNAAIKH